VLKPMRGERNPAMYGPSRRICSLMQKSASPNLTSRLCITVRAKSQPIKIKKFVCPHANFLFPRRYLILGSVRTEENSEFMQGGRESGLNGGREVERSGGCHNISALTKNGSAAN